MSMDLRALFKRQTQKNEEKKQKKGPVVIDDEEDFKVTLGGSKAKGKKGGKEEGGAAKRKRARARIMDSDSEEEAPNKKVKATPPKRGKATPTKKGKATPTIKGKATPPTKVGKPIKGGKSLSLVVKKEVKNVSDFFGSTPVKRSSLFKKSSSSSDSKKEAEDIVRVSESPTGEIEEKSPPPQLESSQVLCTPPTKKLRLLVERVSTPPPKLLKKRILETPEKSEVQTPEKSAVQEFETPQKSVTETTKVQSVQATDSPVFREKGEKVDRVKEGAALIRQSPRGHLKRGRKGESEREKEGERDAQENKKSVTEGNDEKSMKEEGGKDEVQKVKRSKPRARKVIKYLDDSDEEGSVAVGGKKEQTILTAGGTTSGKGLGLASPSKKPAASPRKQSSPDREGYLVKQPGLTFDKEKSASPVKTPRKTGDGLRSGATSSPAGKQTPKPVPSPAKPVTKAVSKPVTPVSTPKPVSKKPVSTPGTTPSGLPNLSRGSSYRDYLNRSGPKAPGSKVIPEGEENCFEGLTFVITGVLESLQREEAADIVKRYGGKVTGNVSKKTNYLVVGEDAGQSKLGKAEQLGTKKIDEDGLLELLRTRTGRKAGARRATSAGSTRKKGGSRTPSLSASPPSSQGGAKRGKIKSKSPPRTVGNDNRGGGLVATPTRHHVTTPVAVATPSPSTSSVAMAKVATPKMEDAESLLWVDKYRPRSLKSVIGQQGEKSNARKLLKWLKDWEKNHSKPRGGGGAGKKGGGGWGNSGQGDGTGFRATLLSGPPGVGKTTTAVLACEEAGYSYVELNASATRSKKTLHDEVATHLDCMSLDAFRTKQQVGVASGRRHALIMDEVDGMAGNEDRGGVQEVIAMVKSTKVPIICICNDRQHTKIRSLANHCFDLRFYKPRVDQIRGAMMSVCYKEGIKMSSNALAEIIMASGQDVRQVLHNLSVWTATDKCLSFDQAKATAKSAKKESKLNPFDVIKLVFMPREGERDLSLAERSDLFFHDYSLAPLFVQENYVSVRPLQAKGDVKHTLRLLAKTADCLSDGDLIERRIRSSQQWGLLPVQAVFSSVLPGQLMRGHVGRPEFPRWLGNHSTRGKNDRLLQDLQRHTRLTASCNKTEFGMDYLPFLHTRLTRPLVSEGSEGVSKVVATMTTYDLVREDWDSIVELNRFPGRPDSLSDLPSKVKAAFTRTYNKEGHMTHYATDSVSKKSRTASVTAMEDLQEDSPDVEPESDSELSQDSMVKVKASKAAVKGSGTAGRGKGKGKAGNGGSGKAMKKGKTRN